MRLTPYASASLREYNAPSPKVLEFAAPQGVNLALQLSVRRKDDVVILDLQGRVTIGNPNDELSRELRALVGNGARKILVNLSGVSQVDSSGISTIVRTFVTLRRERGSLKLLRPVGHVLEVLDITHLSHSIPIFEDEAVALESFRQTS